jgi:hypothetical protein
VRLVRRSDLLVSFLPDGRLMLRSASAGLGLKVPPQAAMLIAFCSKPRTREEAAQVMGPPGASLFDSLAEHGVLCSRADADDTPTLFEGFAGIGVHRDMLADDLRLEAYRDALAQVVNEGDVVIDAGSGTGALAVYAALAGAGKVYALERTDFSRVIPQVAEASGVTERIQVERVDFGKAALPELVDVIVTETFGRWALDEGALPDLSKLAERHLKPGGHMVPRAIELWVAPMKTSPVPEPFVAREDGLDLSPLAPTSAGRSYSLRPPAEDLGPARLLATVPVPSDGSFKATLVLAEPCEALCCWFVLDLAEGIQLSTSPHEARTHWKTPVLPIALKAGVHDVSGEPAPEDRRVLLVRIDGQEIRVA